jgi:hypothetical protein
MESLVEAANERLDVLEYKGQLDTVEFSHKIASDMVNHESAEVRKFIARILPENASLLFDPSETVRHAAAKTAPLKALHEASRKFPNDVVLKDTLRSRKLLESKPALEAAATSSNEEMLSDDWYEGVARKLIQDYSNTLDTTWKSSAVKQYCSSVRATTRLPVDSAKLMKKMSDLLEKHDEERAESLGLNESAQNVIRSEDAMDPVDCLMNESLSPQQFLDRSDETFNVKYAILPPSIMKYKIREGLSISKIPVSCTLPHGSAPRRIDELALDSYVKHWNDKQKMMGEPFTMKWDNHPEAINKITFKLELK